MPSIAESFMAEPSQISIHDSESLVYMSLPIFSKLGLCETYSKKIMLTSSVPLWYSGMIKSRGRFGFALPRNKILISLRGTRNYHPWLTCSARDLTMKLAFIPVVINKSLRNINFNFAFAEFHRLCVFLYCQDYAIVSKGKNLHCLSRRCFLQDLQRRLFWLCSYRNHPLEFKKNYNLNNNARSTVALKTWGFILALPPNQCL